MMEKKPKFKAIDHAITSKGFLIVFLVRLSPIMPYGLCNYLFGVTSIEFWSYNLSTFLGLLPGTVAYTYIGSAMKNLADIFNKDDEDVDVLNIVFLVVGCVLTLAVIVIVTVVSKRAIDKAIKEQEAVSLDLSKTVEFDIEAAETLKHSDNDSEKETVETETSPLLVKVVTVKKDI